MIKFTKMEGIGNDYVYIYLEDDLENLSELSIKMSNRHFGVGSDGIIIIRQSDVADFKMEIYNSDGSVAEMCGNGIRCVGKYVYDKGLTDKTELDIETLSGIKHLSLFVKNGKVDTVTVDMGVPIFNPSIIPVSFYDKKIVKDNIEFVQINAHIEDMVRMFSCVSMGNPHAVSFFNDIDNFNIETYGPLIENDKRFPNKTNVEFIEIINRNLMKMRVWERGVGETLACGTGACASVCASVLNGLTDRNVEVQLLGGKLNIEWADNGHIYMTGPAKIVFEGEFNEN